MPNYKLEQNPSLGVLLGIIFCSFLLLTSHNLVSANDKDVCPTCNSNDRIIDGWARVKGTKSKLNYRDVKPGYEIVLIETQLKNVGSNLRSIEISLMYLEDSAGRKYRCQTGLIEEMRSSIEHLYPQEALWYTLAFEVPKDVTAEKLLVPLDVKRGQIPTQEIPIFKEQGDSEPQPMKSSYRTARPLTEGFEASLCGLKVEPQIEIDQKQIHVRLFLKNRGSETVELGMSGCSILGPYIKDFRGRYLEPTQSLLAVLASDIEAGKSKKVTMDFDAGRTKAPWFLILGEGEFYPKKKIVLRLPLPGREG